MQIVSKEEEGLGSAENVLKPLRYIGKLNHHHQQKMMIVQPSICAKLWHSIKKSVMHVGSSKRDDNAVMMRRHSP